jgi:8-oxo-dGTP pyrophosphatase MutT (NUDIX family)
MGDAELLIRLRTNLLPAAGISPGAIQRSPLTLRLAAVLVLLYPREGGPCLLLTRRPDSLPDHPGQISLPGGAWEPEDSELWHTALRETQEEIGVRTGRVRLLGRLEEVPVAVSGFVIVPFVAWNPVAPRLRPNPTEVEEIIEVPLAALLDPRSIAEEVWPLRGGHWRVTFYRMGTHHVWGATARILSDLSARLVGQGGGFVRRPGSVLPA